MVRIFLVEDNAMMRSHLRAALERMDDWKVVGEAEDGRSAVETWSDHAPNLTVMDFVMPKMDGLQAAKEISAEHPESPILMVTIDPSRELASEARKAGIKGLCSKADLKCLLDAVEVLLKGGTYFHADLAAA
jgi:NarL family two-component system response regulator LiaR